MDIKDENNEIKIQLKKILSFCDINYKLEIIKQPTLKFAHIYCKINQLSGQLSGTLIEYYIKYKYSMIKNKAESCIGDLQYKQTNIELKISNGGKYNNKFNFVQLRMNHACEYIFTAYYINNNNIEINGELFIFKLNKINIINLILNYGHYAHGTKKKLGPITEHDLKNNTNNKEYALRPKYDDKCWKNLLKFRIRELCI